MQDDKPVTEHVEGSSLPQYMTTQEAAEFLRCSKSYLDKLRVAGGGPEFLRPSGGKILYTPPDLITWAESRRCRATNDY